MYSHTLTKPLFLSVCAVTVPHMGKLTKVPHQPRAGCLAADDCWLLTTSASQSRKTTLNHYYNYEKDYYLELI